MHTGPATLDLLVERATSGLDIDPKRMFCTSMVKQLLEDPSGLWCNYHAPRSEARDETPRFERLRTQWAAEFKENWVRREYPEAVEVEPLVGPSALVQTLSAMLAGAKAINRAQLWSLPQGCHGVADILVRRDDAPSDLGPFHYCIQLISRSKIRKDHDVLEAVLLNRMLSSLQGHREANIELVLGGNVLQVVGAGFESECDRTLSKWRAIRDDFITPDLPAHGEARSPWRRYTDRVLRERHDLTLSPVVSSGVRKLLQERLGIYRVEELEDLGRADLTIALGPVAGPRLFYKLRAGRDGGPLIPPGGKVILPRRRRTFFFDFESSDGTHPSIPPHVYLIGVCGKDGSRYRAFIARGPAEEARVFQQFIDHVGDPRDAVLFHWAGFEVIQMRGVIERHPELREPITRLLESCVDLKEAIKRGVVFGTRTYSLKEVAPAVGFKWRQESVDAMESMVLYWAWLTDGDPRKISKVVMYNEDDCQAMVHVHAAAKALRKR